MHHALEIQEILSNIFSCCSLPTLSTYHRDKATPDLAALARTCRAFREPALDVLWGSLLDLSPLARCLPEASDRVSRNMYTFNRPLTQTDWDVLRSYTRRIRSVRDVASGLDEKSIKTLSSPPTTWTLFPNLRILRCEYTRKTMPLLHLLLPSLVSLEVEFESLPLFQNSLKLFPKFSPKIEQISIHVRELEGTFSDMESNYLCRWRNLRSVDCRQVGLDVDALAHLSRVPALVQLTFTPSTTFPASDSPLVFSNLRSLTLYSASLDPISQLLSQIRLPVITRFTAYISNCPSRQELSAFLAGLPTSNADHTIERLEVTQSINPSSNVLRSETPPLGLEDLRPCMAFSNLRHMELNIERNVDLTDSQALTLVSAWPKLERLLINVDWGWNSPGGITLGGLVQLLQTCRSLSAVALALDTRGYTESCPSQVPASLGLTWSPELLINVVDSVIEAESVPAVATFITGIATCSKPGFFFQAWSGTPMLGFPNVEDYMERWDDVQDRVNDALDRDSESGGDSDVESYHACD